MAISVRLQARHRQAGVDLRSLNDMVSLLQVADASLGSTTADLQRRADAAALWRALNASPEDILRDAARVQAMDADISVDLREGGEMVDYHTEVSEGMVVLDAVHQIQAESAPDLACRWNCKA